MAETPRLVVPAEVPSTIAVPRPSASVVVVRDGSDGLEVFMLERHLRSDFAGGAYVFPGGTLDAADADATGDAFARWPGDLLTQMGEGDEQVARALAICGIRETFEESGVLLARTRDEQTVVLDGEGWPKMRAALAAREVTAAQMARETGIRYAVDLLRFWARWVTPEFSPKRYDTRFFIAFIPPGQEPLHDDVETTASRWITPADALAQARAGKFSIIFPTRKILESLSVFATAQDLYDAAVDRPTTPILPTIVTEGDKAWIRLPGDPTLHEP